MANTKSNKMKDMIKCPHCGQQNKVAGDRFHKNVRYFCIHCGEFLQSGIIQNLEITKLPAMKLARIMENISNVPHINILWDDIIDKYTTDVERIRALYNLEDIKENRRTDVAGKMDDFLSMCRTADFQIAFVGTIKTGKSTLINALLGKNYASMAVTPETAALTKFRSSSQDYVKVSFYNDIEWKKLWDSVSKGADTFIDEYKNLEGDKYKDKWIGHEPIFTELENDDIYDELKKWSSSQSPEHYFVREIEVGISNLGKDFPKQVVFVDTPGLSDPVAYRSDITRDYIKKANAVFVCIDAQKMYQSETETIADVFSYSHKNKKKVHIIATHWDTLNDPIKDWKNQKAWLMKQLVGRAFFDDSETAEENILPAAAYIYNLCRDYDALDKSQIKSLRRFAMLFEDEDEVDIYDLESCLSYLVNLSNVENIKNVIKEHVISNFKELLLDEIGHRYQEIRNELQTKVREERIKSQKLIEDANLNIVELMEKEKEHRLGAQEVAEQADALEEALRLVEYRTQLNVSAIIGAIDGVKTKGKPKKAEANIAGKVNKYVNRFKTAFRIR